MNGHTFNISTAAVQIRYRTAIIRSQQSRTPTGRLCGTGMREMRMSNVKHPISHRQHR